MSAILYENPSLTVFLVDIPTSIAIAQGFTRPSSTERNVRENSDENGNDDEETAHGRVLLSSPPLLNPYPNQPEPKTAEACARVLENVPESECAFYEEASPLIRSALEEIKQHHHGDWCLQRQVVSDNLQPQMRKRKASQNAEDHGSGPNGEEPDFGHSANRSRYHEPPGGEPPLILSPCINQFSSLSEIQNTLVKNTSSGPAVIHITPRYTHARRFEQGTPQKNRNNNDGNNTQHISLSSSTPISFRVPPKSTFIHSSIPESIHTQYQTRQYPIPSLPPSTKFSFILLDPPWHNRSVCRSRKYVTKSAEEILGSQVENIIEIHIDPGNGIAGIWVTNNAGVRSTAREALRAAGLRPFEEWIWVKTTTKGETVLSLDGVWRKPYEVLILGRREDGRKKKKKKTSAGEGPQMGKEEEAEVKRRIIAAVPDVHSRKPNLKELVERVFFSSDSPTGSGECRVREYSALEVFARNLTAGWTSCGDEVLRFNWDGWWV